MKRNSKKTSEDERPEGIDPAVEDAHWQASYRAAPYVDAAHEYHYYQPAYRFGWESYSQYGRRSFDEVDETLMREWDGRRGHSLQTWNEARDAARDAWERIARQQREDSHAAGGAQAARGRGKLGNRSSPQPPISGRARKRS